MHRVRHILRVGWLFSHIALGRNLLLGCAAVLELVAVIWRSLVAVRRRKQRLTYLISVEKREIMGYRVILAPPVQFNCEDEPRGWKCVHALQLFAALRIAQSSD